MSEVKSAYLKGAITAYVKPTNYCNVGCLHCYLPENVRANKMRMSDPSLKKTGQLLQDMGRSRRAHGTHVIWHGGEPLTVPASWYHHASDILQRAIPNLTQSMQTSLIPYTSSYAELAHTLFDSHLGSSIDFSQRQIKGSNARYQDIWLSKVDMARQDGIAITPGMVPTKHDIDCASVIVDWFDSNHFTHFNIDRYNCFGDEVFPDHPSNKEHAQFLIGVFDAVMSLFIKNKAAPIVNVITAVIGGILYDLPGDRWGGTCQSDFVVVEPDGRLNSCPDRSSVEASFGDLDGGFNSFSGSAGRKKWIRIQSVSHQNDYCSSCENNSWCKTGCPITCNTLSDNNTECAGYKTYITHVRRFIQMNPAVINAYLNQYTKQEQV